MVVVLTEVSAGRPPPLTEPERNAMASLPTVTNSRTAWKGSPSGGNCSISFRTRQGQAACGGGYILPPVRNLRTAFRVELRQCFPIAYRRFPRCGLLLSLKRIGAFRGAYPRFPWREIIINNPFNTKGCRQIFRFATVPFLFALKEKIPLPATKNCRKG